jgi:hypothetical protein
MSDNQESENKKKQTIENLNLIKGVFLLLLAVSGNFVGETLGCQTQYLMTNNMIVKQLIIYFLIYFTVDFTSQQNLHPVESFKKTTIIWVLYLLFTKMNITYTGIAAAILVGIYISSDYATYYQTQIDDNIQDENNQEELDKYQNMQNNLLKGLVVVIIVGFLSYLSEKRQEYGQNFNFITFLMGVPNCKSLQ